MSEMAYVGRRQCGCVVAAIWDLSGVLLDEDARKDHAAMVGDLLRLWRRSGLSIDRVESMLVPLLWYTLCQHAGETRLDDLPLFQRRDEARTMSDVKIADVTIDPVDRVTGEFVEDGHADQAAESGEIPEELAGDQPAHQGEGRVAV